MRIARFAVIGLFLLPYSVEAAEPPADTPAAAFTRQYKMLTKVTLDLKDASLKEAIQAISDQLEEQKRGRLVTSISQSVPTDVKVTYQGTDVPVLLALDAILKPLESGFVIISKEADRTDGWVVIGKGTMRGYPSGIGPNPETIVKAIIPDKTETPKATEQEERLASMKLELAKKLQSENEVDRAKIQLKFIVRFYPGTQAAREAKPLLEKLSQ